MLISSLVGKCSGWGSHPMRRIHKATQSGLPLKNGDIEGKQGSLGKAPPAICHHGSYFSGVTLRSG